MLGTEQERWLLERLSRSTARWNVIGQQVLMMDLDFSRATEASKRLPGNEEILRRNPSLRMLQDRRGYGICNVTQDRWTTELISLSHVTSAQAPSNSVARFVVEPARAGIANQE